MADRELNFGVNAADADYQIRDTDPDGGDLVIEHQPTGATFEYDSSEDAWIPTAPIGTDAREVPGVVSQSVEAETASIGQRLQGSVRNRLWEVEATDAALPGWHSLVEFTHSGSNGEAVGFSVRAGIANAGENTTVAVADGLHSGSQGNWGSTGETFSIDPKVQVEVDGTDNQTAYLQIYIADEPATGVVSATANAGFGASISMLDAPALTDSS